MTSWRLWEQLHGLQYVTPSTFTICQYLFTVCYTYIYNLQCQSPFTLILCPPVQTFVLFSLFGCPVYVLSHIRNCLNPQSVIFVKIVVHITMHFNIEASVEFVKREL